jgi:MFS family permease
MSQITEGPAPKSSLWKKLNFNVKILLLFVFTQSLGRGIWMGNVLSSYIYLLAGESNQMLGWTSAATGVMMTLVVFPAGVMADRFRRDILLKSASVVGIASIAVIIFSHTLTQVIVALVLWGLYQGLTRPSLEALFADSVPSGTRSRIYTVRQFISMIAMVVGPLLNIVLFSFYGDEWDLGILRNVMFFGFLLSLVSLGLMWVFNDAHSLGEESESLIEAAESVGETPEPILKMDSSEMPNRRLFPKPKRGLLSRIELRHVPYILIICNIIIGLGAGMTIKFFPVFFMEDYDMSPILVQIINALTFFFTGAAGLLAQHFSKSRGRPQMIFSVQFSATLCLIAIAFYPPLWALVIIFILRGSLMNAAQPLSRSILMDIIPKEKRGKWNSFEALAWGLFWNFSAVVGGYLIGSENNFRRNFLVTAGIYVLGTLPLILLFRVVSREKTAQMSR